MWYAKKYDPLQAGSIDGTDSVPHDHGIIRAQLSNYLPPRDNNDITSDPYKTLFVGRLNPITTEVTGDPRGYAFIEFDHEKACEDAYKVITTLISTSSSSL
ncbi:4743_t:CDS:2 [Entrophospora sp. SA101]|nr:4743_t:CDS:2 [Entrophospora sp. SA101]CAJ0829094.1 979_t:CDS:2 [Entrophospora sp. SA101]CAJ0838706.1 2874_t:CDS:2 [Entrophospora sp. SA101]